MNGKNQKKMVKVKFRFWNNVLEDKGLINIEKLVIMLDMYIDFCVVFENYV